MSEMLIVAVVLMAISTIVDVICIIYENKKIKNLQMELKILETEFEDFKYNYASFRGVIFDNYNQIKKLQEIMRQTHEDDIK